MAYQDYKRLLQTDSDVVVLRVLRSKSAALILCFLQEAFKTTDYSPKITHEILINKLADFLEVESVGREENLDELILTSEEKAAKYLKDWVRDGYLSLFTDESGQDLYSLTPGIENGLEWVASLMQKRSFVGTESRFLDIFHKLRELVQNTSDDWEAKIMELEQQRSAIDAKIRAIQLTKRVEVFEDYQIKDRFQQINIVARRRAKNSRSFRLIVVDEAFSKLDEDKSKYLLQLCKGLGLQLMVVTPLTSIHLLENDVSVIHWVTKSQNKNKSTVRDIPILEYQEKKESLLAEETAGE